ncbi:NAD(P)-binding protein [Aspergillus sclerotioniger CBS 115572]|uniref:NAD(P)-binding protein n=1 Tax=Aspergillus sclerotioniger CBS 115572 TaxID=1450535 RepID=A0A317X9G8_9EURO|nr:NAD(P)-binding protein [Aspergillus sclerotioniger CBS 115572]PWY93210.1 NAD(P)-binding protein [Aspergillus sclerotioniger CBS 115572]
METPLVAVVTGANRGIGRAICTILAQQCASPLVLYTVSRAGAAIDLGDIRPTVQVHPARLSLTGPASISTLSTSIGQHYQGCDVLINNAGIYYYKENLTAAQRRETLAVNYRGTLRVCQAFLRIMRPNGRIVNLSSQSGQLKYFHPRLQERFLHPDLTLEQLAALIEEYSSTVSNGTAAAIAAGWPALTYFTSKAALNAATRILARDNPHLLINCCCPGWVDTPLGGQAGMPPKTVEEGARIPLRLGFGKIGNISGRYWANDSVAGKGDGKVQDW